MVGGKSWLVYHAPVDTVRRRAREEGEGRGRKGERGIEMWRKDGKEREGERGRAEMEAEKVGVKEIWRKERKERKGERSRGEKWRRKGKRRKGEG